MLSPMVTSTIPLLAFVPSAYSRGLIQPRRWPAIWSAIATTPENSGEDSLVPPTMW